MASVVDIACPFCDRIEGVQKRDLDRYYCPDCEREFSLADLA
jgi:transposase-like protein